MGDNKDIYPWHRPRASGLWCAPPDLWPSKPPEVKDPPENFFAPLAGRGPDRHELSGSWFVDTEHATYSSIGNMAAQIYPYAPTKAMYHCDSYEAYSWERRHFHRYFWYDPDTYPDQHGWVGATDCDYAPNHFIAADVGNYWNDYSYWFRENFRPTDIPMGVGRMVYIGHASKMEGFIQCWYGAPLSEGNYFGYMPNQCAMMPHYARGAPDLLEAHLPFTIVDLGGPNPLLYADMSVRSLSCEEYLNELERLIGW